MKFSEPDLSNDQKVETGPSNQLVETKLKNYL